MKIQNHFNPVFWTYNVFIDNYYGILIKSPFVNLDTLIVCNNAFKRNSVYAIKADAALIFDATSNYFGASTGPNGEKGD